jgi:ribosomal protein S18 acetylase RimI-like enzyme
MDEAAHLERYLRFMRSPVYDRERDLVAVAPDGRIGSFVFWWPDSSGVAQIEPFGTHPDFQRQGIGKALSYHALTKMKDSGMTLARVVTDESRLDANGFYEGVGFEMVGKTRSWAVPAPTG